MKMTFTLIIEAVRRRVIAFKKIVLIGAPGSGKTSCLKALQEKFLCSKTIFFAPETATQILNLGIDPTSDGDLLQVLVTVSQLVLEQAVSHNETAFEIVCYDRSVNDWLIYNNQDYFSRVFSDDHPPLKDYDLIIFLESCPKFCGTANNPQRYEESQIRVNELSHLARTVYPQFCDTFVVIPYCSESISSKVDMVAEAINSVFGEDIFIRKE